MEQTLFGPDTLICPTVSGSAYVVDPFAVRP
jgi:hypothetical protein